MKAERAFVYAKACGIIGKSFVEKRMSALAQITSLADLNRLVFPDAPQGSEASLPDTEQRIIGRSIKHLFSIIDAFSRPAPLLKQLLLAYEYADLKNALSAIANGEKTPPPHTDLGGYGTVNFAAYPNPQAMLRNTEYAFLLKEALDDKQIDSAIIHSTLDRHYYTALWAALRSTPRNDCLAIKRIIMEEIALKNAAWALRLRCYYAMTANEVLKRLSDIKPGGKWGKSLADDAIASLSLPLDAPEDWRDWKRRSFLNEETPGSFWKLDPRHFQNAASWYLYNLARASFRRRPFSLDTAACFIKLKQFEEQILTSIAEGARVGLPAQDVFTMLGATI